MSTENSNLSNFDSSTVPSGDSLTIGLVVSKWNEKITESLFNGAYTTLTEFGVKANNIKRFDVPGSFELVFGSKKMIQSKVDVVIAIGCVIKGEVRLYQIIKCYLKKNFRLMKRLIIIVMTEILIKISF